MPEVSVVMPTYNYGRYIERAIRSVQNQTYRDFEIIVVDDASTDHTPEVIRRLGEPAVRYIRHTTNRGGNAARNTGILSAKGAYIALLDSDDDWLPEKLSLQMEMFAHCPEEVGLIYTGLNVIDVKNTQPPREALPTVSGRIFELLLRGNFITGGGSSAVVRRSCFEAVGLFDETLPSGQEWEMILRIAKVYEIQFINKALVNYYIHGANTDTYPEKVIRGYELIFSKHLESYQAFPSLCSLNYYELGLRCLNYGFMKRGRSHFLTAFRCAPFGNWFIKIKSLLQIGASYLGEKAYHRSKKLLFP